MGQASLACNEVGTVGISCMRWQETLEVGITESEGLILAESSRRKQMLPRDMNMYERFKVKKLLGVTHQKALARRGLGILNA